MSALDDKLAELGGFERARYWRTCRDGWVIAYTTTPLVGGAHPGKWVCAAWRPIGGGVVELAYLRVFARRKDARARSVELWQTHEARKARKAS